MEITIPTESYSSEYTSQTLRSEKNSSENEVMLDWIKLSSEYLLELCLVMYKLL